MLVLGHGIDCFYPLKSCSSGGKSSKERPPRNKKDCKSKKENRKSRDGRESTRNEKGRGRSKSREGSTSSNKGSASNKPSGRQMPIKRIGAAYMRSSDSIVTKGTSAFNADRGLESVKAGISEETYTTESASRSGSSSEDTSCDSKSNESNSDTESLTAHLRNILDMKSIATDEVAKKQNIAYSWFQSTLVSNKGNRRVHHPPSPTNSVGAVKRSIKSKFDYIRKNQQFSNLLQDPPSDKSLASSHSIKAEDAGSLLRGTFANAYARKQAIEARKMQLITRKNALAKHIIQKRSTASRTGFDP